LAAAQITLTGFILILFVFVLGFVADPIIGLYVDPWSYMPWNSWSRPSYGYYNVDDEPSSWYEHFAKGFASVGVLGFLKVLIASPFSYFRIGGGGGRRATTGRDRVEQVSWIIILIGVATFLAVCAFPRSLPQVLLTWNRRYTKGSARGVVEHLNEPANELWTYRMKMTTMMSNCMSAANISVSYHGLQRLRTFYGRHFFRERYALS